LIIALGTTNSIFADLDNEFGTDFWRSRNEKVKSAEKILVVGGGPVGIELAGELAEIGKNVTLLSKSEHLATSELSEKFQRKLRDKLKVRGIKVVYDGYDIPEDKTLLNKVERRAITTQKGTSIETDLIFDCTGNVTNHGPLSTHFGDKLDNKGRIRVNKYLQVEGNYNILY
jgi:apoptosis-inducing factor 2